MDLKKQKKLMGYDIFFVCTSKYEIKEEERKGPYMKEDEKEQEVKPSSTCKS